MNVLVIEDEKKVADFIAKGLQEAGFLVHIATSAGASERLISKHVYDVIILDIMLPDKDGFTVLQSLREHGIDAKVLMLTALDQLENKVRGLNLGADDYLTKPFDFEELSARINALLRRGRYEQKEVLTAGDIVLDKTAQRVTRAGKLIELTHREFMLLEYLLLHKNEVVTRTMIAQHVWNLGFETGTNVIDVYINYLRRKIDYGFSTRLIRTIRNRGYMLQDE